MNNNQDPKPSIIDGLSKFYKAYSPNQMPSREQMEGMAKDFAGREGDLWRDLYGHYEKASPPPEDYYTKLSTYYNNPFLNPQETAKKKRTHSRRWYQFWRCPACGSNLFFGQHN